MSRLVLASNSPRRKGLLSRLVDSFELASSNVEDEGSTFSPAKPLPTIVLPDGYPRLDEEDPQLWAWRKAFDVATSARYTAHDADDCLILSADTVVVSRLLVLGKPSNLVEARGMLRLLRGTDHFVVTGFALLLNRQRHAVTLNVGFETTRVVMRAFSEDELEGYVATGEPFDKAGAYALQGEGGKLVSAVEGCATNVVGLPLCQLRRLLEQAGVSLRKPPDGGYCAYCPTRAAAVR